MDEAFLNQARADLGPVHTWFLKIDPVWIVGMRVRVCACVSAPEDINNYWYDVAWYEPHTIG